MQLRDGVTPIWTGVLDSIPTRFERNGQHRAEVTAFGVLSTAENPDVSGGSLTPESTAQAFIELCAKGDVPSEQPQPQPGDAYVMRRWWEIGKLWGHGSGALDHIEDTEGGFVHEDREGEVGFHLANFRGTRTVNKTFVSTTPGANQIRIVGNPRRQNAVKDVHNVVSGDVRQFETKADETVFMSEEAIPIALGGRIDLVSVYPISRGAVSELDALVAGTDWSANTSADGTGNNRTSQVTVTVELMDFNEIHIQILYPTMTGTQADTLYIRGLTVTGTVLSVGTALRVTREDTVSKERYGPETLTLNGYVGQVDGGHGGEGRRHPRHGGQPRTAREPRLVRARLGGLLRARSQRQGPRGAADDLIRRVQRGDPAEDSAEPGEPHLHAGCVAGGLMSAKCRHSGVIGGCGRYGNGPVVPNLTFGIMVLWEGWP